MRSGTFLSTAMMSACAWLAAASLGGCGRDPVESELVGTWEAAISSPTGAWLLRFTTLSNGQYRTEYQGQFAVPVETGYFAAGDGEWRMEKIDGGIDEGTYEFLTDDSVLFRSSASAIVWNRVTLADPFAPGVPQAAPGSASNGLLSTGPFGTPPQAPSAGGTADATGARPQGLGTAPQAFGAPGPAAAQTFPPGTLNPSATALNGPLGPPAPFGVPKATPGPVFSAGGNAFSQPQASSPTFQQPGPTGFVPQAFPPQDVGNAVGGVRQQLESDVRTLTDVPEQTLDNLERSAQQGAARAISDATAPVTDVANEATQKAGERVQVFTGNAVSKVRNFFTGRGKRNRDKNGETGDEPESP